MGKRLKRENERRIRGTIVSVHENGGRKEREGRITESKVKKNEQVERDCASQQFSEIGSDDGDLHQHVHRIEDSPPEQAIRARGQFAAERK